MRHATAILAIAAIAVTGCGSESQSTPEDKPQAAAQPAKPTSARAQMMECIEDIVQKVTHENQAAATAVNFSLIDYDGRTDAVLIIHPDAATADKSAQEGKAEGLDDIAYGRVEVITHAADETEARLIANCVADAYDKD